MQIQAKQLSRAMARLVAAGQAGVVFERWFTSWRESVAPLLTASGLLESLGSVTTILIKPNLVKNMPPPATTPVALVAEIVGFLQRARPKLKIIIAEGTGDKEYDTAYMFRELGYVKLAGEYGIELLDLNEAPLRCLTLQHCRRWPELYLPEIIFDADGELGQAEPLTVIAVG